MYQKLLPILVSGVLTVSLLAGCGSKSASTGGEEVTYWIPFYPHYSQLYTNYSEVPFYQELQKRTGVSIKFVHPSAGQEAEGFSLMVASRDLPDIFEYSIMSYKGGPEKAISDKVILDLTSLLEKNAPNLSKILKEHSDWDKMVKTDSGKYYTFPAIRGDDYLTYWSGPQMRQDYLDAVGMKAPETVEEWEAVLTAFQQKLGIEYPMEMSSGQTLTTFGAPYHVTGDFYLDQGKVKYGPMEDGYLNYLKLMNSWVAKGLLDPDFATQDSKTSDAKIASGKAAAYFASVGGGMGNYISSTKQNNPNAKLTAVKAPVAKKGDAPVMGFYQYPFIATQSAQITASSKKVEAAMKLLDYGYGEEGHMFFNFGTEGVSYNVVDGYPKFTDEVLNNPDGLSVMQAMSKYAKSAIIAPMIQDKRYFEQYMKYPEQTKAPEIWTLSDTSWCMPTVTLTIEETNKTSSKQTEISTYVNEKTIAFIMGAEPLSNFDAFRETIKTMGVDEVLQVQQAAYDRYQSR